MRWCDIDNQTVYKYLQNEVFHLGLGVGFCVRVGFSSRASVVLGANISVRFRAGVGLYLCVGVN